MTGLSGETETSGRLAALASHHCIQLSHDARIHHQQIQVSNKCIAVRKVATLLQELTCHIGSHIVTCHPAEVTFPPLPQPKLVLDSATPEGCKAELT